MSKIIDNSYQFNFANQENNFMRISHLDGLRGIAILWVLLFHAYARRPENLDFVSTTMQFSIFEFGYLGVQLFFMISGFVIFMTLDKSKSYIDFMKRRWLRLFPAMLIATILIFATSYFFYDSPRGIPEPINALPGLLFLSPQLIELFSGIKIFGLEGAFWSLYVEVIFYALIAIVYFKFGRKFCIPFLFVAFIATFFTFGLEKIGFAWPHELTSALGFIYYPWFLVGCVLYEVVNKRVDKLNIALAFISIALSIFISFHFSNYNYNVILYSLIIILLFISSFYISRVQSVLSTKFLLLWGFVSYPLYLIHENILVSILVKFQKMEAQEDVMYILPLVAFIPLFYVSYFISLRLEPSLRRFLQARLIK